MAEQVRVRILQTCERRILDAKDQPRAPVLREGQTVRVDTESAAALVALGYAEIV